MSTFVGQERQALVRQLVKEFDRCVETSRPKLVCLSAEAGHGKTRIVQELYRTLQAARQPHGRYWPAEFAPASADPMRSRKLIHPEDPRPEPAARIPWLWWGLRCEEDSSGRKVRALFNDRVQLRAHLVGLIASTERRRQDVELAVETVGEVVGMLPGISEVVSAAVLTVNLAPKLVRRAYVALERGRQRRTSDRQPEPILTSGRGLRREFEPELEFLRRFIDPELPLVLIVDDAHDSDVVTTEFLAEVMKMRIPALVVVTAWPSALADQRGEHDLSASPATFGAFLDALMHDSPDQVSLIELEPLRDDALRMLIRDRAPATDSDRQGALVEVSDGNPLVLELQLTSGKVTRSIVDGAIRLSPAELSQLPRAYGQLVAERFVELPSADQRWLAEAACQGAVFFPELLSAEEIGVDADRISRFARTSVDGGVMVGRFLERPLHAGVLSVVAQEFSDDDREEWSARLLEKSVSWWLESRPTPEDDSVCAVFSERFVRLADRAHAESTQIVPEPVATAAIAWSFAERNLDHPLAELEAANEAVSWAERSAAKSNPVRMAAKRRLAAALMANDQAERALSLAKEAVSLLGQWADAPPDEVSNSLTVLSRAYLLTNDLENAREVTYRSEAAAKNAGEARLQINALSLRAIIEDEADDNDAEAEAINQAIAIAREIDPPDIELLLELETDLADVSLFGDPPDRWRDLEALAASTVGAGHRLHLDCVRGLALALMNGGRIDEAATVISRFQELQGDDGDADPQTALLLALNRLFGGDVDAFADLRGPLHEGLSGPGATLRMRGMAELIEEVLWVASGKQDPRLGEGVTEDEARRVRDLIEHLQTETDQTLSDFDVDDLAGYSEFARSQVVMWASQALIEWFVSKGELHRTTTQLLPAFRESADADRWPVLATSGLDALEDALLIMDGQSVPTRPAMRGMLQTKSALCRAVAWFVTGDHVRAEKELLKARESVSDTNPPRTLWLTIVQAHRTCGSPAELGVLRALAASTASAPLEHIDDLVTLGHHLYGAQLFDEAEAAEATAWREVQNLPDADPQLVQLIAQNLASTLEARDGVGDADRATGIRRELLGVAPESRMAVRNMVRLAFRLDDLESEAATLARSVVLETDPRSRVDALTRLAFVLHELGRPELAFEASVLAIGLDPAMRAEPGTWPTPVANVAALAAAVFPEEAAGLEERVKAAGFENKLLVPTAG